MTDTPTAQPEPRRPRPFSPGIVRIRRKLIVLHTIFSLGVALALLLVIRAPMGSLVSEAEGGEAQLALALLLSGSVDEPTLAKKGIEVEAGTRRTLALDDAIADRALAEPGRPIIVTTQTDSPRAVVWDEASGRYQAASVSAPKVRTTLNRLYILLVVAMLAIYAIIALALELFVLPRQVYEPIERLRLADDAVQTGDRAHEMIPETQIPDDELGEVMRTRNRSIEKLRTKEQELSAALDRIEAIASELKRKNHLLETARRNLADQDRLASLGMMSAGIAHELNTPLAVLKGTLEQVSGRPGSLDPARLALMTRVVARLERLGEGLLDFARVRPAVSEDVDLRGVLDEAWLLVSLDQGAAGVSLEDRLPNPARCVGDTDRLTQVMVNLLRNAVQAAEPEGTIIVTGESRSREGHPWFSVTITDSGPGIDPAVFSRLFEPFASTRLDASGTGLGLAIAEGIVKEHGGALLARNATEPGLGAQFEVMLPAQAPPTPQPEQEASRPNATTVH